MNVLNLDPGFKPVVGNEIEHHVIDFPSGCETHVRLEKENRPSFPTNQFLITTRIRSADDIMRLLMATDALRNWYSAERISLFMPFVPYARMDRDEVFGDAFGLRVFADLINAQGYDRVYVFDPHSPVSPALIRRCVELSPKRFIDTVWEGEMNPLLVSPDAGSAKRLHALKIPDGTVIQCDKHRDPQSGQLVVKVVADKELVRGRTCIIVDDICDGGGTFIPIARALKTYGASRVVLAVSHGLFTKGFDSLFADIDHIACTNAFSGIPDQPRFTQYRDWSWFTPLT